MTSLYERLGGEPAINAAVENFYGRILGDPILAPVFAEVEMNRLKFHQRRFLGHAFGGPGGYQGRDLAVAHRPIAEKHGLDDRHFDAVIRHLRDTLTELGVDASLSAEALAVAESVRAPVLGHPF
ncbi:MAG TPA: group 1 truncated hemoglobin [Xanthomonadaceae bacterium]|nr:group 1 truncated hemoglobin [Xanthomonadaceae bacterium]